MLCCTATEHCNSCNRACHASAATELFFFALLQLLRPQHALLLWLSALLQQGSSRASKSSVAAVASERKKLCCSCCMAKLCRKKLCCSCCMAKLCCSYCVGTLAATTTHVSSYYQIHVLILRRMCPHTTKYTSSYCHIRVLTLVCGVPNSDPASCQCVWRRRRQLRPGAGLVYRRWRGVWWKGGGGQ
jgi:hypothetical protein